MKKQWLVAGLMSASALMVAAPVEARDRDDAPRWGQAHGRSQLPERPASRNWQLNDANREQQQVRREQRAEIRSERQEQSQQRRDDRQDWRQARQDNRQDWRQAQREDRQDWSNARRDNRQERNDARRDNRQDWRDAQRDNRQDWREARRDDRQDWRTGARDGDRDRHEWRDNERRHDWRDNNRRNDWRASRYSWNQDWRRDNRYDWRTYRERNRHIYRRSRYYAPYGWNYGYRSFSIGISLWSGLYDRSYWIDDPYYYRLPPAYGSLRWVRYYDDALLVDIRTGYVVDVIHDFFW